MAAKKTVKCEPLLSHGPLKICAKIWILVIVAVSFTDAFTLFRKNRRNPPNYESTAFFWKWFFQIFPPFF